MAKKAVTPDSTINVTPSVREFLNIAKTLRTQVIERAGRRPRDQKAMQATLDALLEIVVYLGAQPDGAELAADLIPNFCSPKGGQ